MDSVMRLQTVKDLRLVTLTEMHLVKVRVKMMLRGFAKVRRTD
jgi:hypothetical protein